MKTFYIQYNVGKIKYLVNYHNGVKTHPDGSPFFDIATPKNKKDLREFTQNLIKQGYLKT